MSHERTITVTEAALNEGRPTNIPSVFQGRQLSQDLAVKAAAGLGSQGVRFPAFESIEDAEVAARRGSRRPRSDGLLWQPRRSAGEAAANPIEERPAGFVELFGLELDFLQREEQSLSDFGQRFDRYEAQERLAGQLGERVLNPFKIPGTNAKARNKAMRDYEKRIAELRGEFPDAGFQNTDDILSEIAAEAKVARERLAQRSRGATTGGTLGMFAAGLVAGTTDPLVMATLPFGAAQAGIVRAMLAEAAIAGATEVPIQFEVARFKQVIDSPFTTADAALNVGAAAAGAGILTGLFKGAGAGIRGMLDLYDKSYGTGKAHRLPTQAERDAVAELRRQLEISEETPFRPGDTAAEAYHTKAYEDAHGRVLDALRPGVGEAKREIEDTAPELRPAVDRTAAENEPDPRQADAPPFDAAEADAPTMYFELDPGDLAVDAARFQFKRGADTEGVSGRLKDIDRWDQRLSGTVVVFEDAAGKRFIADGHQRHALATRMRAKGQRGVRLNGFVLREADGFNDGQARAIAAAKNIAEGTGSAIDAARMIREVGIDELPPLPPRSRLVQDGTNLARLSDDGFGMVINDVVPANYGAIVGRVIDDAGLQVAALDVLAKASPANAVQAESIVADVLAAGFRRETQETLFGSEEITQSLFAERARVLDATLKRLKRDRATFKTLLNREGAIAEAGNVLSRESNLERLTDDQRIFEIIQRLANRAGPVADALNIAARQLAEGGKLSAVTADFLGAVKRGGVEGGGGGVRPGQAGPDDQAGAGQGEKTETGIEAPESAAETRKAAAGGGVAEGGGEAAPASPLEGEQAVIPGAEKISERELAERQGAAPLTGDAAQRPPDEGLFDVAGRGQMDLIDEALAADAARAIAAAGGPDEMRVPVAIAEEGGETITETVSAGDLLDGLAETKRGIDEIEACASV